MSGHHTDPMAFIPRGCVNEGGELDHPPTPEYVSVDCRCEGDPDCKECGGEGVFDVCCACDRPMIPGMGHEIDCPQYEPLNAEFTPENYPNTFGLFGIRP